VVPASADETADQHYTRLLALALRLPTQVNYITFRAVYAASSHYHKADSDPIAMQTQGLSIPAERRFIDDNFPLVTTQIVALDPRLAAPGSPDWLLHNGAGIAILETLLHLYDAKTTATAIPVLVPSEEDAIARYLNVAVASRKGVMENGRSFEVLSGIGRLKRHFDLWFDISAFQ
jgi:hypothetical protein